MVVRPLCGWAVAHTRRLQAIGDQLGVEIEPILGTDPLPEGQAKMLRNLEKIREAVVPDEA